MNATTTDEIPDYVAGVRAALSGLPEALVDELLEDLPEHLAEVAADGIGTLTERLGPPSVYAAELLASAGYAGGGFPDPPPRRRDPAAEMRAGVLRRLRTLDARTGPLFGYARSSEFLVQLRPAWWVLRGYAVVMLLIWLSGSGQVPGGLMPRLGGSDLMGVLLTAGAVLASIWLGRRTARGLAPWPRFALRAGTALLALFLVAGFATVDSAAREPHFDQVDYSNPHGGVQDVFVYDSQGRLVDGARLFDQDGEPIRLGEPFCHSADHAPSDAAPDDSAYPFCPSNAPFTLPSAASGSPSAASPSARPASPAPAPTR